MGVDLSRSVEMKTSKPWIVLATVFSLLIVTSAALAAEDEEGDENTVFNFGYDSENQVFVWGASSTDGTADCTLIGVHQTKYVTIDGRFWVDDLLTEAGDPVTFPVRDDETAEPVPYASDGECALSGGRVSGPNGQVNHGMFMKLFNSMFEGRGRGCVMRHLAKSDLGKGDQMVKVPDVDDEVLTAPESGTIDFESVLTQCAQHEDGEDAAEDEGDGKGKGKGKGKPDHAGKGKPPWAGKPGGPNG